MIWLYLVDSCSIAGIWKKDFRGLNFNCNVNIDEKKFSEVFGSRLIDRGNYYFIPKFLRFQCPKGLNSNKPAILSIVKEVEQNNLIEIIQQSLGNDFLIIKGKDKGKGTGEGKGKDKGEGNEDNFIMVSEIKVFDVLPVLQFYEIQLNGTQKENSNIAWQPMVNGWFLQHIGEEFKDAMHVKNSFKKYYLSNLKPRSNGTQREKAFKLSDI